MKPTIQRGTTDKKATLNTSPHYFHDAHQFKKPRTVFCSEPDNLKNDGFDNYVIPDCYYDYSDRIYEWDSKKADKAATAANEYGYKRKTAEWYQAYLIGIYGRKVELVHIIVGINFGTGWPYCVFGTRTEK